MVKKATLFLIDGSALAYRSYFGTIRNRLTNSKGQPTGATFVFVNSLLKIAHEIRPDYLGVVFDAPEKTFRHAAFAEYKSQRPPTPEELVTQFPIMFDVVRAMNITLLTKPGFEADDVIGTLARQAESAGMDVYIVTGDKDFMQLLDGNIYIYKPGNWQKEEEIIDRQKVIEKLGILPEQVPDYLALTGDSSDNIPGVAGIGPAKAQPLLAEFGSLEAILANTDRIGNPRIAQLIREGAESARFSKMLATIKTDVPLDLDITDLAIKAENTEQLTQLYRELEFFSLLRSEPAPEEVRPVKNYQTINSVSELESLIGKIRETGTCAVDLETNALNPHVAEIVGIALSFQANTGYYVPIKFPAAAGQLFAETDNRHYLTFLKGLLEDESVSKCGQNLKYDMLILKRHGINLQGFLGDTMVAAFLIQPDARSYKLDKLSQQYLKYQMQPIEELIGKGKTQIRMDEVAVEKVTFYAAEDADVTFQLKPIFEEKLKADQTWDVFRDIEMPLVPVLMQMEENGVFLDIELLKKMSSVLDGQIKQVIGKIYKIAGVEFNINSPKQLGEILFDKLNLPKIKGYSTDVTVLEKLRNKHALPDAVLEYRGLVKLQSTYLDALPQLVNPQTGRVHSSFNQTVAATGRLSSSDPNFQNIPVRTEIGREIRKAFIPQKSGWQLLSADYSQIELRIMAHLSGDAELVRAFAENVDIHTRTAARVYGVEEEAVLPEMRRVAKVVNFGIMYGAGPFRMSEELGIPRGDASRLIEQYFRTYPGINDYILQTLTAAREQGFVHTLSGRRRYVPDINSENRNIREAAERMAINMPIQGTAADMIKIAMLRIQRLLNEKQLQSMLILQIHDELLFEVPNEEIEIVKTLVATEMEQALPLRVPIRVDVGVGNSWYEAH